MLRLLPPCVLAVIMTVGGSPARASVDCPEDSIWVGPLIVTSTAAAIDTSYCPYDCWGVAYLGEGSVAWPAGTFYSRAFTQAYETTAQLKARDSFTCTGISVPTSLTVRFRVQALLAGGCVTMDACAWAYWHARFAARGATSLLTPEFCASPCDRTVEVPIVANPGEAFDVEVLLRTETICFYWCGSEATVNVTLTFPDLPPSASIRSCKGFAAGLPTPTRKTTWGRVKALYR